jgi:hypothetical protein
MFHATKTLAAAITIAMSFALVGCAGDEESAAAPLPDGEFGCQDFDGDGFGIQCEAGPDCDDEDADVAGCEEQVVQPCEDGAVQECKETLPEMNGVQNCFVGVQVCDGGEWGPCVEGGAV